jgi:predicted permease
MWTTARWLQVMARLRPRATRVAAAAEASALLGKAVTLEPGGIGFSTLRGRFARPLVVLEGMVGLVLLIACANLANLLLAGATARRPEIALRQAIGAGRARLVRQLFTESLLVSFLGMLAGLAIAGPVSRAMLRYLPPDSAPARINLSFQASPRVFEFTAILSLVVCLLFALAPAIRATGPAPALGMKRASGGWMSRLLIVGQVAMCTLLLMVAGLFVRSLRNLQHLDTGFSAAHLTVADLDLPRSYGRAQRLQRIEALRTQAAALPGVRNAAVSHIRPLSGFAISGDIENQPIIEQHVSPGFFAAMGTPLLLGRDFTDRDDAHSPPVAVVNETFARQFLPAGHPLGPHFGFEIAGVVKDTRWINLRDQPPPMYYRPYLQWDGTPATLVVRGAVTALQLSLLAHSIDPAMGLKDVAPFSEMEDRTLTTERMVAQGSAAFGLLALLVACIGLYGVLAYAVARRTGEIGIRMALGASRAGVQWMVVRESLLLLAVGFLIGAPAALVATRYTASMLFGLTPADPLTLCGVFASLLLVALVASFVPACRAASVDPLIALRYE